MKTVFSLMAILSFALTSSLLAQPAPEGNEPGRPAVVNPPPSDRRMIPLDRGVQRPPLPPQPQQGPNGPQDLPPGQDRWAGYADKQPPPPRPQIDLMRDYLAAVNQYAQAARDPSVAGVAAVIGAADVLRQRGTQPAIDFFTKILPNVKDETISRAIRHQLADLYRASGQSDKALEQYEFLITSAGTEKAK